MRATLKRLHSPDIDLQSYWPDDPLNFGFLLQAFIGPDDNLGEESFGFVVCTPRWLESKVQNRVLFGMHHLIVGEYDLNLIEKHIQRYCERCVGTTWQEVATKLARVGQWEFDNYQPDSPKQSPATSA